jgi:hypothetical protein
MEAKNITPVQNATMQNATSSENTDAMTKPTMTLDQRVVTVTPKITIKDHVTTVPKKTHRKNKRVKKVVEIDAKMKPYIGAFFSKTHCYRIPDVVRIVGVSSSGKSFKVEPVPVQAQHWRGGGNGWVEKAWLDANPLTENMEGQTVRHSFENDDDDGGKEICVLKMNGDYLFQEEPTLDKPVVMNFSWCEY